MTSDPVSELLAKQEIYELCCRYIRGLDRARRELMRAAFHDDAVFDLGYIKVGPDEFCDFGIEALASHEGTHHMLANTLIEFDGDTTAYGEIYFHAHHRLEAGDHLLSSENAQMVPVATHDRSDLIVAGRYVDRYEKRDGVWKIAYRAELVDWARTQATQDGFFDQQPETLRGSRVDDLVFARARLR